MEYAMRSVYSGVPKIDSKEEFFDLCYKATMKVFDKHPKDWKSSTPTIYLYSFFNRVDIIEVYNFSKIETWIKSFFSFAVGQRARFCCSFRVVPVIVDSSRLSGDWVKYYESLVRYGLVDRVPNGYMKYYFIYFCEDFDSYFYKAYEIGDKVREVSFSEASFGRVYMPTLLYGRREEYDRLLMTMEESLKGIRIKGRVLEGIVDV